MTRERVEVSITLPRTLWEEFLGRVQSEHADETTLLIRAIEQFLHQQATEWSLQERLQRESALLGRYAS